MLNINMDELKEDIKNDVYYLIDDMSIRDDGSLTLSIVNDQLYKKITICLYEYNYGVFLISEGSHTISHDDFLSKTIVELDKLINTIYYYNMQLVERED